MKAGFVNIFGRPNAGKSTLLNALIGEKMAIVSPKVQTTRHRIKAFLNKPGEYQVIFSDTPGIIDPKYKLHERMMDSVKSALEDADLALLLRTLLIAEGFVRRLDPGFDIAARAAPIARELLRERIGPAGIKRGGRRLATSLGRLAAASPELVAFAERVARSGALPIELQGGAVSPNPTSPWRADPNILSAGLLVAGAILQRDHDVVGAMMMASAVLPAAWAWFASRQRR